ncbi:Eco57I restriction-modification methylase domain-containing protein [Candidatus Harpocratesius sp.]
MIRSKNQNQNSVHLFDSIYIRIDPSLFDNFENQIIPLSIIENLKDSIFFVNEEKEVKKYKNKESSPNSLPVAIFSACEIFEHKWGNITQTDLGFLFEKFLQNETKQQTGAYYTPAYICEDIALKLFLHSIIHPTIKELPFVNQDSNAPNFSSKILNLNIENEVFDLISLKSFILGLDNETGYTLIRQIYQKTLKFRILDPAVGTGDFLIAMDNILFYFYKEIWDICKNRQYIDIFSIYLENHRKFNLFSLESFSEAIYFFRKYEIFPKMLYGVDINPRSCRITKWRLYLKIISQIPKQLIKNQKTYLIPMNIHSGNSLIGWDSWYDLDCFLNGNSLHKINIKLKNEIVKNLLTVNTHLQQFLEKTGTNQLPQGISALIKINHISLQDSSRLLNYIVPHFKLIAEFRKNRIFFLKQYRKTETQQVITNVKYHLQKILDTLYFLKYSGEKSNLTIQNKSKPLKSKQIISKSPQYEQFITKNNTNNNFIKIFHWILEFPEIFPCPSPLYHPELISCFNSGFNLILGNPPYGNLLSSQEKKLLPNYDGLKSEISSLFISKINRLLRINGSFGLLTSYTICFNKKLSKLRKNLINSFNFLFIATFDRDKCRLFDGMTQSVSILLAYGHHPIYPKKEGKLYTTQMFRKLPSLMELEYQPANSFLLGDYIGVSFNEPHRVPKIGTSPILELLTLFKSWTEVIPKYDNSQHKNEKIDIIRKTKLKMRLGNWIKTAIICKDEEKRHYILKQYPERSSDGVWIRISGNYWYNSWHKPPYCGTQIAFLPLKSPSSSFQAFLLCLINSSLFYTWFRIFSDGRHMNKDILAAFPLPVNFSERLIRFTPLLKKCAEYLMNKLFQHYDSERRRFNSSQIKDTLNIVDLILGILLKIPKSLVFYVLNFESSIRGRNQTKHNKEQLSHLFSELKDISDQLMRGDTENKVIQQFEVLFNKYDK